MQAHDSFQNPRQSGGEAFAVQVQGVIRDSVQVKDRQNGTYLVEYSVPAEGTYQAHVTLNGAHVIGSPASITAFRLVSCCPDDLLHNTHVHPECVCVKPNAYMACMVVCYCFVP